MKAILGSIIAGLLVCFLGMVASATASFVPLTYNAISDPNLFLPSPAVPPPIGGAGSVITDPTFGSRIARVTDGNTEVGTSNALQNTSFLTTSGGFKNVFNQNSTRFYLESLGGAVIPFNFNPATMVATCFKANLGGAYTPTANGCASLPVFGPEEPEFSYINPNMLYGLIGTSFASYDFSNNTTGTIFNFAGLTPATTTRMYARAFIMNGNDNVFATAYGTEQDLFEWVIYYNRATNTHHVLDTYNSMLDGKPLPVTLGFGVHSIEMSLDGNYIFLSKGHTVTTSTLPSGPVTWDVATGQFYVGSDVSGGHHVAGYNYFVDNAYAVGANEGGLQFIIEGDDPVSSQNPKELMPAVPNKNNYFYEDNHISWNNAQPDELVPFFASEDYDNVVNPFKPVSPTWNYDGQIIGVETDGFAQKVWRFAYNYTDASTAGGGPGNFYSSSRGNVSPDGRFYIFNSNWKDTLGVDPAHGYSRVDAFIVDLVSAHNPASAAPPVVSVTAPAASSTIFGTVNLSATASDVSSSISSVQFKVDGGLVGNPITTTPYAASFNTLTLANGVHTISAVAYDSAGDMAVAPNVSVAVNNPDITPPTIPTGLTAGTITTSSISLSWGTSADNVGVDGYKIYRTGSEVGTSTTPRYTDTGLTASTTYRYIVSAYDAAGNNSPLSAALSLTTLAVATSTETTPPTVPNPPVTGGGSSGGGVSVSASVPPSPQASGTASTAGSTTTLPTDTASLAALLQSLIAQLNSLIAQENALLVPQFTRSLTIGSVGNDVSLLQKFLDLNGYPVASSGLGSAGDLSTYFGGKTAAALSKFQSANGIPATGFLGPLTRQYLQERW